MLQDLSSEEGCGIRLRYFVYEQTLLSKHSRNEVPKQAIAQIKADTCDWTAWVATGNSRGNKCLICIQLISQECRYNTYGGMIVSREFHVVVRYSVHPQDPRRYVMFIQDAYHNMSQKKEKKRVLYTVHTETGGPLNSLEYPDSCIGVILYIIRCIW